MGADAIHSPTTEDPSARRPAPLRFYAYILVNSGIEMSEEFSDSIDARGRAIDGWHAGSGTTDSDRTGVPCGAKPTRGDQVHRVYPNSHGPSI